jgi:hypothetical protein
MQKNIALFLDRMYMQIASKKTCNLLLEEDKFENNLYTIDEFDKYIRQYIENPYNFYKKNDNFLLELTENKNVHEKLYSSLYFKSPIKTNWENNNIVPIRHYRDKISSNVLLIFAHGWARPNFFAEHLICKKLLKLGIDTVLPTAPFHMDRSPLNTKSGEYFISANMFWTIENFRQFAIELIELISYYKERYKYVGLIGMSSGGFQAGLALTSISADFYFPFITGAKLGSITWNGRLTQYVKNDLIKKGITENDLNIVWGIADQVNVGQHCKAKYIKQFISLYDEIVPTEFQKLLWKIYNEPERIDLKCGHNSSIFCFDTVVKEINNSVKEYL